DRLSPLQVCDREVLTGPGVEAPEVNDTPQGKARPRRGHVEQPSKPVGVVGTGSVRRGVPVHSNRRRSRFRMVSEVTPVASLFQGVPQRLADTGSVREDQPATGITIRAATGASLGRGTGLPSDLVEPVGGDG